MAGSLVYEHAKSQTLCGVGGRRGMGCREEEMGWRGDFEGQRSAEEAQSANSKLPNLPFICTPGSKANHFDTSCKPFFPPTHHSAYRVCRRRITSAHFCHALAGLLLRCRPGNNTNHAGHVKFSALRLNLALSFGSASSSLQSPADFAWIGRSGTSQQLDVTKTPLTSAIFS